MLRDVVAPAVATAAICLAYYIAFRWGGLRFGESAWLPGRDFLRRNRFAGTPRVWEDQGQNPELLTAEQVAARLEVKPSWVHMLAARGDLPHVYIGPRWKADRVRFRPSDVDAWLRKDAETLRAAGEGEH